MKEKAEILSSARGAAKPTEQHSDSCAYWRNNSRCSCTSQGFIRIARSATAKDEVRFSKGTHGANDALLALLGAEAPLLSAQASKDVEAITATKGGILAWELQQQ